MSIVCLLFVAIIPLCSINIYNYSQAFSTTSQEETLDDEGTLDDGEEAFDNTEEGIFDSEENNGASEEGTGNEEGTVDGGENISSDDEDEVTTTASGYWTDYATENLSQTNGTYIIDSAGDLAWMANQNSLTGTYNLAANINLSLHYWKPIMNFSGTFNGNGYTINGFTIFEEYTHNNEFDGHMGVCYYGLFGSVKGGVIRDVIVKGNIDIRINVKIITGEPYWKDELYCGGIVGYALGATIERCVFSGDVYVATHATITPYVGGICGCSFLYLNTNVSIFPMPTEIRECIVRGKFIVYVQRVYNAIDFTGKYMLWNVDGFVGGIVGAAISSNIEDCVNYATFDNSGKYPEIFRYIVGNPKYIGGIAGVAGSATINHCINYGVFYQSYPTVEANDEGHIFYKGGLAGYLEQGEITNCISAGKKYKGHEKVAFGLICGGETDSTINNIRYINSGDSLFGDGSGGNSTQISSFSLTETGRKYMLSLGFSYDEDEIDLTWTGIDAYGLMSFSRYDEKVVVPSFYIKRMNIRVLTYDNYRGYTGSDFVIKSSSALVKHYSSWYEFYAVVTNNDTNFLTIINNEIDYAFRIFHDNIGAFGEFGEEVEVDNCANKYSLYFKEGTYHSLFDRMAIILEPREINEEGYVEFGVVSEYSETLFNGQAYLSSLGLVEGTDGGEVEILVNGSDINVNTEWTTESTVSITLRPNDTYEVLGLYTERDFNDGRGVINSRIDKMFNDYNYGDDEARVDVRYADDYSWVTYEFVIGDMKLYLEDDVSSNSIDCGDAIGVVYEYTFYAVFISYRQEYYLDVRYDKDEEYGYGEREYSYGYADRALYTGGGSYEFGVRIDPTKDFYNTAGQVQNTIQLSWGSEYFNSPKPVNVEYVAEFSEGKTGYWSSAGHDLNANGLELSGSYVSLNLETFLVNAGVAPGSTTVIKFHRIEGPLYTYDYYLHITDGYEEYGNEEYSLGQLVGETNLYNRTMISKIDVNSLSTTVIPFQATYMTHFVFNYSSPLDSYFDDVINFDLIVGAPPTYVGGGLITINSTLNQIAPTVEKEPITGYRAGGNHYYASDYTLGEAGESYYGNTSLLSILQRLGNIEENGNVVTLYSLFHLRNPYDVVIQTAVDGVQTKLSMPAGSSESIVTAFDMGMSGSSLSFSCEPFAVIDIDVTDKLVYRYDSLARTTTFYSFDNITLGSTILSESDTYTFQGMPTNDISSYVISVNFKEEFTISNSLLDSDTSINYNSSIWYVDSDIDLLNIAYRMYCQGLEVAKKLVQTADIDFEDGYMIPIGTESNPFTSVYDGQYYRIENMTINGGNAEDIGLFGYTSGATIKNLTLMNAEVNGGYDVGTVVGHSESSTFERVGSYNGRVSMMETQSAGTGIFLTNGYTATSVSRQNGTYTYVSLGNNSTRYTLLSVMVADEIANNSDQASGIGDFAGRLNSSEIDTCFVRKSRTIDEEIGGFVGNTTSGTISHAYTSRMDFVTNTTGTSMNHIHTQISDITTCPECADRFIW